MQDRYLYLLVNAGAILVPFIAGFDRRLRFYRNWKYLFPSMLLTMLFFIPWDMLKTSAGVWGFNPRYITGIFIGNLPVEEWLFFIAIPYACVFSYESLNYLVKKDYFGRAASSVSLVFIVLLAVLAVIFNQKLYTVVTFSTTVVFLLIHRFLLRKAYTGRFYFSFMFVLIPFFIVNGILTGSWIDQEVVWYDNAENLGIRLGTIPVEDSVYGLLLLMMNVTFYEFLKEKFPHRSA